MELWKWAVVVTGVLVLFLFLYEIRSKSTTEEFQDAPGSKLKSLLENWVSQHSEIEEGLQRMLDTQATIREALRTTGPSDPKKKKPKSAMKRTSPPKKAEDPPKKAKDHEDDDHEDEDHEAEEEDEDELSDVTDDEEVEGFVSGSAHGYMRV